MLFNSFTYLIFLPIIVALHWLVPARYRTWLLLIASYLFYMNWIPVYGLLILCLTLVNYGFGLAIAKAEKKKKLILVLGLCFNLCALCFFKYAGFIAENIWLAISYGNQFLHSLTPHMEISQLDKPVVNVLLPLGISFFTFEFIHYIVDVYKGSPPISNLKNFALFAAFFPSQIAGPIKRYQDFMAQLARPLSFRQTDFRGGIFLILQGLYKKVVLGDNLGLLANYGFTHTSTLGRFDTWIAVVGFTFQIFFDFAGYTDIGRGSALLLGYKVPENFNWPFAAANLSDFWRRWHMSLSTWLRDYLFIPMGGSRVPSWLVRRNLLITMILGGLWHGAAWHYVLWGAFHGLGLVITKDWQEFVSKFKLLSNWRQTKVWHYSGVAYTFLFLCIASIFFRADTLKDVWVLFTTMLPWVSLAGRDHQLAQMFWQSTVLISALSYCLFLLARVYVFSTSGIQSLFVQKLVRLWDNSPPFRYAAYACVALTVLGFAPSKMSPFIYFQF